MRGLSFEAPMRPLDVQRDMYLDYTNTQAIKFYNKGCEKLSGEAFSGKMLLTWLVQVQDKANMFTWTPILTIKGKLLTQHYTEITMEDVRAHAQVYQDRASRQAQNAEMRMARELRTRQMLQSATAPTVGNDAKVALPTDFLEVRDLNVQGSPRTPLTYMSPSAFSRDAPADEVGRPTTYTIIKSEFVLAPKPDTAYTLEILYYAKPTVLSRRAGPVKSR